MEVVEVSPPYDVNDNTAQLACRVMLDVLGTLSPTAISAIVTK